MECHIQNGKKNIKNNYFSFNLGNSSTKLQGLWFISNWCFKIPSQASVTPPDEPANGKYVFALPGSSGGVTDAWNGILKHQLDINHKPCNFVELFPRLKEK